MARLQASWLLQPHAKKNKTIKPKDVCVFAWETKKVSTAERERRKRRRAEIEAKWDADFAEKHNVKLKDASS